MIIAFFTTFRDSLEPQSQHETIFFTDISFSFSFDLKQIQMKNGTVSVIKLNNWWVILQYHYKKEFSSTDSSNCQSNFLQSILLNRVNTRTHSIEHTAATMVISVHSLCSMLQHKLSCELSVRSFALIRIDLFWHWYQALEGIHIRCLCMRPWMLVCVRFTNTTSSASNGAISCHHRKSYWNEIHHTCAIWEMCINQVWWVSSQSHFQLEYVPSNTFLFGKSVWCKLTVNKLIYPNKIIKIHGNFFNLHKSWYLFALFPFLMYFKLKIESRYYTNRMSEAKKMKKKH